MSSESCWCCRRPPRASLRARPTTRSGRSAGAPHARAWPCVHGCVAHGLQEASGPHQALCSRRRPGRAALGRVDDAGPGARARRRSALRHRAAARPRRSGRWARGGDVGCPEASRGCDAGCHPRTRAAGTTGSRPNDGAGGMGVRPQRKSASSRAADRAPRAALGVPGLPGPRRSSSAAGKWAAGRRPIRRRHRGRTSVWVGPASTRPG